VRYFTAKVIEREVVSKLAKRSTKAIASVRIVPYIDNSSKT